VVQSKEGVLWISEKIAASTVCKLKRVLYGQKQSPQAWFTIVMIDLGFKQSQGDHILFVKHSGKEG